MVAHARFNRLSKVVAMSFTYQNPHNLIYTAMRSFWVDKSLIIEREIYLPQDCIYQSLGVEGESYPPPPPPRSQCNCQSLGVEAKSYPPPPPVSVQLPELENIEGESPPPPPPITTTRPRCQVFTIEYYHGKS